MFSQKPKNDDGVPIILQHDQEVSLQSLTRQNIEDEYKLAKKNENYLERTDMGYPYIHSTYDYENLLLNWYGNFEDVSRKRFRIIYKGVNVGQIGLHSLMIRNFQPCGEIFYWIDEKYQGKGIITRAVQRLMSYAFNNLELGLLIIHCLVTNVKSENVAIRCKFNYEGIAKYYARNSYKEFKRYIKTNESFQQDNLPQKKEK